MKLLRLLFLVLVFQPVWGAEPVQNAVFISCDGLGRDRLQELLAAGKLPSFAAVIKEGSMQEIEVKGHRTSTVPSHATMLTGYLSAVHGLSNNQEIHPIPAGLTIFERLEQRQLRSRPRARPVVVAARATRPADPHLHHRRSWLRRSWPQPYKCPAHFPGDQ